MTSSRSRITLKYFSCSSSTSQNIKVSFSYWRWVIFILRLLFLATSNCCIHQLEFATLIIILLDLGPSLARMKWNGDMGSPCLITPASIKETFRHPIYENGELHSRYAKLHLVDPFFTKTCLPQDWKHKPPIDRIISFLNVQFTKYSKLSLCGSWIYKLICYQYCTHYLSSCNESPLLRTVWGVRHSFQSLC